MFDEVPCPRCMAIWDLMNGPVVFPRHGVVPRLYLANRTAAPVHVRIGGHWRRDRPRGGGRRYGPAIYRGTNHISAAERVIKTNDHRAFGGIARARYPMFSEAIRPELRIETESAVQPQRRSNDHLYDGPTIYTGADSRAQTWTWIANGLRSPQDQFGPPEVLLRPRGKELEVGRRRTSLADRAIESFRAEALELDIYDPLTDEAPAWGRPPQDVTATPPPPSKHAASEGIEPASRRDEASDQIEVRILGPVEVQGWRGAPERPILTELLGYLALHRDRPVTGETLRAALRPDHADKEQSVKTLRTYLSMLRKALGPEAFPAASSGGYRLANTVITDWDLFNDQAGSFELEAKLDALRLIRGRPFEGVAADTYIWAFSEFWISDVEVVVIDRAKDAARLCREADRNEDALWALRRGLLVAKYDLTLWDMYLSLASVVGGSTYEAAKKIARLALGDDAPS